MGQSLAATLISLFPAGRRFLQSFRELKAAVADLQQRVGPPPEDVVASYDSVFERMETETLGGWTLNQIVGTGSAKASGQAIVDILSRHGELKPNSRIFEIGSGNGRFALALASQVGPGVRYLGVDMIPGLVAFCRREISSRFPNFEFYAVRDTNPTYDRFVQTSASDLYLPESAKLDGAFDVVVSFSVFTHLQRAEAEAMLRTVWSRLTNHGIAILSFFILDPASRAHIRSKNTTPLFATVTDIDGDVAHDASDTVNGTVGFDVNALNEMVTAAGFDGIYAVQYGYWRSTAGLHYQDVVILEKVEPVPADFDPEGYLDANPDVRAAGVDPARHYRRFGWAEGRRWEKRERVV